MDSQLPFAELLRGDRRGQSLPRLLGWRSAFVLSLGSALLVTVSLGPMAAELGAASVVVWLLTALVGFAQCLLIAELGSRFPGKVGGAPTYCHEGLKKLSPVYGAVSAWSYWIGWVPGVAVNLLLSAQYIKAAFWPSADVVKLTLLLILVLYALNCLGLRFSAWASGALAFCALVPSTVILVMPLFHNSLWQSRNFVPFLPHANVNTWYSVPTLLLFAKWMFVAVWSSYGGEMVATVNGELTNSETDIPKVAITSAATTTLVFAMVPICLVATMGAQPLAQDPYVVFLTAARGAFGSAGGTVITAMLISALVLSAQPFVISSSRALYQMSKDGVLVGSFSKVNRFGVPIGSVAWDFLVSISLLTVFKFKDRVVDVVAAANFGYLLVFVLLPLSYVSTKKEQRRDSGTFNLPRLMIPVAVTIAIYNIVLLVIGGAQWGIEIVSVGIAMVLTFIPFHLFWKNEINHRA